MSKQLVHKLESFRKKNGLSTLALCKRMGIYPVTFRRWKKSGHITESYKKLIINFLSQKNPTTSKEQDNRGIDTSDIAVIGIACYYPGASNVRELWENILSRRVQFRRMLDQRLPLSKYYDPDPKASEKTYLTKAAFIENYQFDWGKLRIPKKTVESTDIAHWLALDIALKTFEDAGYKLNEIPLQNTGVIVGNTLTGEQTRSQSLRLRWPYVQGALNATLNHLGMGLDERSHIAAEMEQIYKSAFYPVTEDSLAGGLANTIAGRICNYLNLKGGGYIVDGACSSSLLAVATAANALKYGDMDLALAGGVDISLDPFELVGFAKVGALAKDKMSVYDQSANGFLPGEGCGFILLKRLEDAIKDKNYVYAVIKGWGISSDGKGGIMEPSSSGQSFAIGRAYKNLQYKISDVDFVEGHGTGTTKGDRVELEGIETAIEQSISNKNKDTRTCGVTSFKSIVGHTKAAAGVGGLIKAIMAVNQRILPPTASCSEPNEVFKDKAKNLYPIIQGGFLPMGKTARAGISSAGFGGINCHITIESKDEPKKELKPKIDERALFVSSQKTEIFVFSSRSINHLKKVVQRFKEDLRNISIAEMSDLAALLNRKVKPLFPIKIAIVTDSPEHLYEALVLLEQDIEKTGLEEGEIRGIKTKDTVTHIILSNGAKKNRIGFLYPGQGSQRLNMARTLVERFKWARDLLDVSKLPLYECIYKATDKFLTKEEQQEFEKHLADTKITQPAVVVNSLIWTEFLSKLGVEPKCVGGHSLGELTAFYKAGAFKQEALVKFAEFRGELMARGRSSGSMVSLLCSKQKAEELVTKVSGNIIVANINSPNQVVVSGGIKEIEKVTELAVKEEISAYRLNVSNAFHSSFMKEASEKIRSNRILPDIFKTGATQVCPGMDTSSDNGKVNLKEYFSKQVISPVNFVNLVENISKDCDVLLEVGPGRVLTDLVKAINKTEGPLCLPVESSAKNDRDFNIVLAELFVRNVPLRWEELYKNRLIKVFVPASRKKFIENQCERPLRLGNQILKSESLRTPLHNIQGPEQIEEIIPGGLPALEGKDNIADLLIDLTHKLTGFEKTSISLNLKLLDDLNLDSIKAGELIGQAARVLGIAGQIDPSQISNNTLGQIRDRLSELVQQQGKVGTGTKESTADILKRYQDKPWIRNFIQKLIPQEITTRNVNQLQNLKNIVLLSDEGKDSLADAIKEHFKEPKVKIRHIGYDDIEAKIGKANINCLIAILPRDSQYHELNKDSIKVIIKRFNKIVSVAHSNQMNRDAFVVFIQFGGGNFGEHDSLKDIASSSAKSLASTLYLEKPELKVRVIDFDNQVSEKQAFLKVIDELQTYEQFNVVGYDATLKRSIVAYENSNPCEYKKRDITWSAKDVVLVTGGAKGITAQCALEFARATKVMMVLVGRSPAPKDKYDEKNEINQTLKRFEKENLKASYYQCDVTDEKNVAEVVKDIEQKEGKVTGIIHGAGLNSLKRLKQMNMTDALNESLPKVLGAVNVCKALSEPPKLIAAITSVIGITGMDGSGWYGLANEVLNLYLHQYKAQHSKTEIVAVAYSVWDEVGMGARLGSVKLLANKGIGAIPVQEGVKHFRQLTENNPGIQQVVVSARLAGLDTWKLPTLKVNHFRFIEKVEYILPGVELIAQAQLNVKDDPYLLDHNWKGSLLFPFVFGFEAMAEAVAYVLGIDEIDYIKARDINLERPISVPKEAGITIEIHAMVLESEKQIKVEIYSQETGYQSPHFSAVFEIASSSSVIARSAATKQSLSTIQQRTKNVIDLDMQTDIYGPILFQGKMFQGIEQIHELNYDEKIKEGECLFTSSYNKSANTFLKDAKKFNGRFLIGEPFFMDTMLQSMQLIIPQDICLPRDIEAIELSPAKEGSNAEHIVQSNIKKIDSDYYRGDTDVIKNGFSLKIKNCRLKILDTIIDNPSANDLVNPGRRDQRIIENKLSEFSKELGFTPPVIKCLYDERLKNAPKELRHKIELPLIKVAVEELLKRDEKQVKSFKIKWLKSGKPVVESKNTKDIGVSISHVGAFLIIVVGFGKQGCDIESVSRKSSSEWLALLGKRKFKILEDVLRNDEQKSIDYYGTALWSVSEAMRKSLSIDDQAFEILNVNDDVLVFKVSNLEKKYSVITFPVNSSNKILFSVLVCKFESTALSKWSYKEDLFKAYMNFTGPQGQPVYVQRFPITFKNTQSLGKNVYFTNYFDWIGGIREYGLYPVKDKLTQLLETGEWGMATNQVKLKIFGILKSNDIVESRLWIDRVLGQKDSVVDLIFDWYKVLPDESLEKVAVSEQRISWIQITGRGEGKIENFPETIREFIDFMRPKITSKYEIHQSFSYPLNFNFGNKLLDFNKNRFLLFQQSFSTTFEESNLVGNIYFSNYSKWLGKTRDLYFHQLFPNYSLENVSNYEFFCTNCEIYHLAEAMPFDVIKVRMYLNKVYENGVELYFEFLKDSFRLAYAVHTIIWGKFDKDIFVSERMPVKFLKQFNLGLPKK